MPRLGPDEVLGPGVQEADRSAREEARGDRIGLGRQGVVLAEGATHGRNDDAHLIGGDAEEPGQREARPVRRLVRRPDRDPPVVADHGDTAGRLELRVLLAGGIERALHDDRGVREGRVGIAHLPHEARRDVAGGGRMHERCIRGHGSRQLEDGRSGLVVHLERCGPVGGRLLGLGDDDRDRLSGVADLPVQQLGIPDEVGARRIPLHRGTGQVVRPQARQQRADVEGRDDTDDARDRRGSRPRRRS